MLNRKSAPPIYPIGSLTLPYPQTVLLDNGMTLHVLPYPEQEIIKIDVIYRAGRPEEHRRLAARAAARVLREGTRHRSGAEIAEALDFYGGSMTAPSNLDFAHFQLFGLKKYAADLLPIFAEAVLEPAFPEHELEVFKETNIRELQVELEKAEVLAYRKITELMFGENHPYGYNSTSDNYRSLTRHDLQTHFDRWFVPDNGMLIATGAIDAGLIDLLKERFGGAHPGRAAAFRANDAPIITAQQPGIVHHKQPGTVQTAIKIGRRLFNRHHPDFHGFFVLNTLLGGYFGSRLMTNIREKRGYTYNIYSTIDTFQNDGYFYIGAEVNADKRAATLREIWKEIKKLQDEPIDVAELDMVRNYLLGMLLNGLDGALNTSDVVRSMLMEQLPWDTFTAMTETIRTISPERIQALAQQYLQPADCWTVTVGP